MEGSEKGCGKIGKVWLSASFVKNDETARHKVVRVYESGAQTFRLIGGSREIAGDHAGRNRYKTVILER